MKTEEELLCELRDELAKYSASVMKLRRVSPRDYPLVDQAFYDRTAEQFANCGFNLVGDFEVVTGTSGDGGMRCFIRAFLGHNEPYSAACYHPRPKFWNGFLSRIFSGQIGKVIELETEFSDDTWVISTTAPKARLFDPPPLFIREHYPEKISVEELVTTHKMKTKAYLKAHPGVTPKRVLNAAGLERSQARQHDISAVYRKMVGGLSADEVRRFSGFGKARATQIKQAMTALGDEG